MDNVFSKSFHLTIKTVFLLLATAVLPGCLTTPPIATSVMGLGIPEGNGTTWPDRTSFVVIDEEAGKFNFEKIYDFVPSVHRVVLLPVVLNYSWEGKRRRIALADPFVVKPGSKSLHRMMAHLETNRQAVWRCIILVPGYCPGGLQPAINYAGNYQGRKVWLVEMAKITDEQYELVFSSVVSELNQATLILEEESSFEQALQKQKIISTRGLKSPILHKAAEPGNVLASKEVRKNYILWNHYAGTKVDICISEAGMDILKKELGMGIGD